MNHETITGTLSWFKIPLLNGFSLIRAKQRLLRRRRIVYEKFLEPTKKPKVIYTGIWKSCGDLSWNHRTSTPHGSETNGIAERPVRRVKEGTSAVLLQSGLGERWWSDSVDCFRYLRHVQDLLADGKTPLERQQFLLEEWLNTTPFQCETNQDFTILARKFYLEHSSAMR